ncbi:MAG TPA: Gfo/Idh/MocA family oxidoreductase [Capsulimonadaceae bacterium]|nr:Gfo/Idh/MocA family oxidoreductase [Capsulimonadaceae bacterium]
MASSSPRIAILSFAHMHAYSYVTAMTRRDDVTFVGIWDEDPARGQAQAQEHGTRFYENLDSLLSEKLDGIMVCSDNAGHQHLVEKAASAGPAAILCEKPISTTLEGARAMIAACEKAGVFLGIAFPCRYSPAFEKARIAVKEGQLGDILAIRATNHGVCPFGWFVEKERSGGGAVIDHTVHVADLNRRLLGKEAVEVYAETGNGFYHQEWEDTGFLTVTYQGGIFTTLDTSWSRPRKSFPTWGDVTMEIVGTGGVISIDMFSQALTLYSEKAGRSQLVGWGSNTDAGLVNDFLARARGEETETLASGYDGLKALEVALAAYRSADAKQPVSLA